VAQSHAKEKSGAKKKFISFRVKVAKKKTVTIKRREKERRR
jgi:hypothetical protein